MHSLCQHKDNDLQGYVTKGVQQREDSCPLVLPLLLLRLAGLGLEGEGLAAVQFLE